jgi:hypothetical protein
VTGPRRLAEEVPAYPAGLQSITAIQPPEAEIQFVKVTTSPWLSTSTLRATATILIRQKNMISGNNSIDIFTSLYYHTCPLMPQYNRYFCAFPPVNNMDIGTADACSYDTNQYFVIAWGFHLKRFDI